MDKKVIKLSMDDVENLKNYQNTPFINYYVGFSETDSK